MQMTGYMFRNAEYRLSLKKSLEKTGALLPGASEPSALPKVSGKISIDMGGRKFEVDAAAYVADLHKEVEQLKASLVAVSPSAPEEEAGKGGSALMAYMQALPLEQVQALSAGISPEVIECMQMLIEAVLTRDTAVLGGMTVVEGSANKLRELLVWQLVTGYRLRELEQRNELNKLLTK
jgi:hypothetical protein